MRERRTSSRAFLALATGGLAAEGAAAWLAYSWSARALPCRFAPARGFFGPGAACPVPIALVGHDTFVPAALSGALVVVSALLFIHRFVAMAVATRRARRSAERWSAHDAPPAMAGLPGNRRWFRVVGEDALVAYCLGLLRPRVVVSSGLLERLDEPALRAVVNHELSHRRRRDPLRHALAKSLARGLFFVPSLGDLADATMAENEVSADALAERTAGRTALAAALVELAAAPAAPAASAAMAGPELLQRFSPISGIAPRPLTPLRAGAILWRVVATVLARGRTGTLWATN